MSSAVARPYDLLSASNSFRPIPPPAPHCCGKVDIGIDQSVVTIDFVVRPHYGENILVIALTRRIYGRAVGLILAQQLFERGGRLDDQLFAFGAIVLGLRRDGVPIKLEGVDELARRHKFLSFGETAAQGLGAAISHGLQEGMQIEQDYRDGKKKIRRCRAVRLVRFVRFYFEELTEKSARRKDHVGTAMDQVPNHLLRRFSARCFNCGLKRGFDVVQICGAVRVIKNGIERDIESNLPEIV